ncbi:tyrosine-type recombinase/integrase [Natrarchaeobius chitinivorans]|uniref:Integrase n=1 Tax=Natrarchaeobius chitinivorans TaxID=1679083 RepID=A0A3N6M1E4_NATCH|nr:integrase [Natrarchaeobius chitinivorans]
MSGDVVQILSEVNDPDTIEKVLKACENPPEQSSDFTQQLNTTLTELYNRFLSRRQNRSPSTRAQYKRTIPEFVDFAESNNVSTPEKLSPALADMYIDYLRTEYNSDATILTYTKNVRSWLQWLSKRDLCDNSTYRVLNQEELGLYPKARDEAISQPEVTGRLHRLRRCRRSSGMHALMELLWNGGPRIGGAHSLDQRDFDPENKVLRFRHRPETGTRLKNGSENSNTAGDGERNIVIKEEVISAIQLYIETERPDVTDEYGREPLFATEYGRASRSTLRRWVYEATSCRWNPKDTDNCSCDGTCNPDSNVCAESYYPHAIRRGSIVSHLSGGLRRERASERFDVSVKVIKKHYDPRTKQELLNDRREAVEQSWN